MRLRFPSSPTEGTEEEDFSPFRLDSGEDFDAVARRVAVGTTALVLIDEEETLDDDREFKRARYSRNRLNWDDHVVTLFKEDPTGLMFARMYRMEYHAFVKLVALLHPILKKDKKMAFICTGKRDSITTEIMLHCLLRWLAGGSYHDVRVVAGISVASFYQSIHATMDAINSCKELDILFPTRPSALEVAASNFRALSLGGAMAGCIAALDGFLLRVQTPGAREVGHVKSFFSGHYQTYGVNVQAACDHRCRFVYVAVAAPGGANDITAFRKCRLRHMIARLPQGKYVVGDNAYVCSESLLTPFSGSERENPDQDSYNFYLSQLRIRIEQAFGFMTSKWRILCRPLQCSMKHVGKVFDCVTRLHNFVIDHGDEVVDHEGTGGYPDDDVDGTENPVLLPPTEEEISASEGNSVMRDTIVEYLANNNMSRPQYNIVRNFGDN